jgi:hypothetical protein
MKRGIALGCICWCLAFNQSITAQSPSPSPSSVAPDKKWEYQCVDGLWSSVVNTDTKKMVLDLSNEVEVPYCQGAQVIWAPDSKRFAFNYSPPHAPHTSYETIALYQLRGDKWVALPSPVDQGSESSQLAQLAREHLPKSAYSRRAQPVRDILKVRSWTDVNTVILYAYSAWERGGSRSSEASFLFTLKFDAEGNSKIVNVHRMSAKEIEKEAGEQ